MQKWTEKVSTFTLYSETLFEATFTWGLYRTILIRLKQTEIVVWMGLGWFNSQHKIWNESRPSTRTSIALKAKITLNNFKRRKLTRRTVKPVQRHNVHFFMGYTTKGRCRAPKAPAAKVRFLGMLTPPPATGNVYFKGPGNDISHVFRETIS